jgi:hypothetical protein
VRRTLEVRRLLREALIKSVTQSELLLTNLLYFSNSLSRAIKQRRGFEGLRAFSMFKCSAMFKDQCFGIELTSL